jgi:superfamily I DNA and/or RNA helicase
MINTIDSFQGQEKDLILISTVRSNDRKQIGFLMDERRINVSITRAKFAMVIIGNGDTLGSN